MAAGHVSENTFLPEAENVSAKNLWTIAEKRQSWANCITVKLLLIFMVSVLSAQSLAERVKGAEVSTADLQMAS